MEAPEEGERRLSLAPETSPEIRHAHYLAIANAYKEILHSDIPPEKLRQAIEEKLAWAESRFKEVDRELWHQKNYTRYFWNSAASGWVGLDDEMRVIGDRKVACKWTITYGKKSVILPPSLPVFVGFAGDDCPVTVFQSGDYIEYLYNWLRARVIDDSVSFLPDLDRLVRNHPLARVGRLYFTQMTNGVWELRWNHRHRALPIAEDWFLLELAGTLERVARQELTAQQLWAWVDEVESSLDCSGTLNGRRITLAHYEENGTWCWRLLYRRQTRRVRRYWVGAIAKAIRTQNEKALWEFLHSAN